MIKFLKFTQIKTEFKYIFYMFGIIVFPTNDYTQYTRIIGIYVY